MTYYYRLKSTPFVSLQRNHPMDVTLVSKAPVCVAEAGLELLILLPLPSSTGITGVPYLTHPQPMFYP